jgi:hypothetical protein
MSQRQVYKSIERFEGVRTRVEDADTARPWILMRVDIKEQTYQSIRDNRRNSSDEISYEVSITK